MRATLWLAWKELGAHKASMAAAALLVALLVGLCAGNELVLRAQEAAVAEKLERMGPSLVLVPAESSGTRARPEHGREVLLESELVTELQRTLSPSGAKLEVRRRATLPLEGVQSSVVGVISTDGEIGSHGPAALGDGEVALGSELPVSLRVALGDIVDLAGAKLRVVTTYPSTATEDDVVAFVSSRTLSALTGSSGASEVRVYLPSGGNPGVVKGLLRTRHPGVTVVDGSRGGVAERRVTGVLESQRLLLYALLALVTAGALIVWSYVNAAARSSELAVIVAIGGSRSRLLVLLTARAVFVGALGGLGGLAAGVAYALRAGGAERLDDVATAGFVLCALALAIGTSALGALPVAAVVARRDHFKQLEIP